MIRSVPHEHGRFYVKSGSGDEYLVDIEEYEGNGFCACRDFECRHQPALERELDATGRIGAHRRCKHIVMVMNHLAANQIQQ